MVGALCKFGGHYISDHSAENTYSGKVLSCSERNLSMKNGQSAEFFTRFPKRLPPPNAHGLGEHEHIRVLVG